MEFKASLDKLSKIISVTVAVLLILIAAIQVDVLFEARSAGAAITIALVIGIIFIAAALRAKGYYVDGKQLIIRRGLFDVRIPRRDIISVELLDRSDLKGAIRIFGVGGMFGYVGTYANLKMGSMTWYATRRDRPVLIRTSKKKIVVTPDEPELFLQQFRNGE